jgi:hypothetical protein
MGKTIRTEEAREIRKHAIEFERKLIADWLRHALPMDILALIHNGDYRNYFAHGTLPNKNGEFFQPFEGEKK